MTDADVLADAANSIGARLDADKLKALDILRAQLRDREDTE